VPINPSDVGADEDPQEFRKGGTAKIEFNPNHIPNKWIYSYAKKIKEKYPKVWDMGGNIFGNEAFKNLERVVERGYWTDNEEWMYIKWQSYVARHHKDFRIAGTIAMLKWVDKTDKGWDYMKALIEKEIAKKYPKKGFKTKMKTGGKLIKRADGSYSKRGLWDNIRANIGSGKKPTKQMLEQEAKIRSKMAKGGGVKDITCKCGWGWNKNESEKHDEYVCHKCGTDNKMKTGGEITWSDYRKTQFNEEENRYLPSDYFEPYEIRDNLKHKFSTLLDTKNGIEFRLGNGSNNYIGAFDGEYLVGYADNGSIEVSPMYQKKGIGLNLITLIKQRNPSHKFGNMTPQGFNLMGSYYDKKIAKKQTGGMMEGQPPANFENVLYTELANRYKDGGTANSELIEQTLNIVYNGKMNSDDAAIQLDESGIEVDEDLYDKLRDAEKTFLNKNKGLQVGDIITVKGKNGNQDFKGNFRGFTNDGKLIVVYEGGNQMMIGKDDYYKNGGELKKGIKSEKEHIDTAKKLYNREITPNQAARSIAMEHLKEDPKYYSKMETIDFDKHYDEIKTKYAGGGSVEPTYTLNTPSGDKSRLTYLQQVLVRTTAFKNFFGDWETAAKNYLADNKENFKEHFKNVSKVMDMSVLEPRAVYHGTKTDEEFFMFDVTKQKGVGRPYAYFAHNKQYSENFTDYSNRAHDNGKPFLYECFLNIRNPFRAEGDRYETKNKNYEYWLTTIIGTIAWDKYNTIEKNSKTKNLEEAVNSQIEKYLSDKANGQDIPFWNYMARDTKSEFKYFLISYGYDGIFYSEEYSSVYDVNNPKQYTKAVCVFTANDIKLANGKNLNFDPMTADIRYEEGGVPTSNTNGVTEHNMTAKDKLGSLLFGDKYAKGGTTKYEEEIIPMQHDQSSNNRKFVDELIKKMKK
jgi:hypothetical protein